MNLKQVRVALKELVESCDCYSTSMGTISKQLGLDYLTIGRIAFVMGYHVFQYEGVYYVGSEQKRLEYYDDKLRGCNPFHQTW